MKEEYFVKPYKNKGDLAYYKKCFDNNDDSKSLEKLEWMHLDNPINKCYVDFAVHEQSGEIGGLYAVFPVRFKLFQDTIIGSQSIDTLVDKNHRRKGLFKKLANSLYNRCQEEEVKFVYGFPNDKSAFAFFNRLEWTSISNVPFLIKIINLQYIKKKVAQKSKVLSLLIPNIKFTKTKKINLKEGMVIKEIKNTFPEEINNLWSRFSNNINFSINRDRDYLNWRIFKKPEVSYKVQGLYNQGTLVGIIVYTVSKKHGGNIGYIVEYMYLPEYGYESENLLKFAVGEMIEQGSDAILVWNYQHSPNHKKFRKVGFLKFPEKLKPIKLFFGIRFFKNQVVSLKDWYISYCDSDTV